MSLSSRILLGSFLLGLLLIAGCDSAGSGMNPPDPSDVEPPDVPLSVAIVDPATEYRPGVALEVAVRGASIETATVTARMGDTDVLITPLRPDTLGLVLPAVAVGNHTLTVEVAGESADVPVTLGAYDAIDDPEAYVTETVEARVTAVQQIADAATDSDVRAAFAARSEALTEALTAWNGLSDPEQVAVAYLVREALAGVETKATASASAPACVADGFATEMKQLTVGAAVFALAIEGGTVSLATAQPWWAAGFGLLGALGGAAFLEAALDLKAMVPDALNCVFAKAFRILDLGKSGSTLLAFVHNGPKTLTVETGYALDDAVSALLAEADGLMHTYADYIPASWLTVFDAPTDIQWEAGAPAGLVLQGLSASTIEGDASLEGDKLTLTFRYTDPDAQPLDTPAPFAFTLGFENGSVEFDATLEVKEFAVRGRWYLIHIRDDGSMWSAILIDFGDGTEDGVGLGYSVYKYPEQGCRDANPEYHTYRQSFYEDRSALRLEFSSNFYHWVEFRYDPATPDHLARIPGVGTYTSHLVLQKSAPPGALCK